MSTVGLLLASLVLVVLLSLGFSVCAPTDAGDRPAEKRGKGNR